MKDLKYLFAYTVPLSAYLSFSSTGLWTYAAVIYAFGIIPTLDVLFGTSDENLEEDEENKKKVNPVFDLMLYINLPIVFVLLYYFFKQIDSNIAKISIIGVGMRSNAGVAAKMFSVLSDNDINIDVISTSEIKISILINKEQAEKATSMLHQYFINENE